MKEQKFFQVPVKLVLIVLVLFSGACNKDLPLKESNDRNDSPQFRTSNFDGQEQKVKKSFRKIKAENSNSLKASKPFDEAKLTQAIKDRKSKKDIKSIAVADATFSATDQGSYYDCRADSEFGGFNDFYLVNLDSETYTYIGENFDGYIEFEFTTYAYNNYAVWLPSEGFTNNINLGDAYSNVSASSGKLAFTNQGAFDALYARVEAGYESNRADFFDNLSGTDDQLDAQAVSEAFDEFRFNKDFAAYWATQSVTILNSVIQAEVDYWFTQTHTDMSTYPEDDYHIEDEALQTLLNDSGDVRINGTNYDFPVVAGYDPGNLSCITNDRMIDEEPYATNRTLKKKIILMGVPVFSWQTPTFKGKSLTFRDGGGLNKIFNKAVNTKRNRLHGNKWDDECDKATPYDTGQNNSSLKKGYRNIVPYPSASEFGTKDNETTLEILLNGNTYSLVYVH